MNHDNTPATIKAPTVARRLLEVASRLGVDCIFSNLGSDHPAFIEAFADIDVESRAKLSRASRSKLSH